MADHEVENEGKRETESQEVDSNYQDMMDQCDTLRRSNLQLREEVLRLERENAELKRENLNLKINNNCEDNKSGPTSIHISSISNHSNAAPNAANHDLINQNEIIESLRAELVHLKDWKSKATQEIVDRDRALADLEHELVKQQSEFDANNEECNGHQRVIQELKSQLDQISIGGGERTIESPFSERPRSSHTFYYTNSIYCPPPPPLPPSSGLHPESSSRPLQSSFARCLNLPPLAMDQRTWLENELLETRQRLIQTEADLMRLEEVHGSLIREHKNLQEDYERIHIYVEELETKLEEEMANEKLDHLHNDEVFQIDKMKSNLAEMKHQLAVKKAEEKMHKRRESM